MNYYIDVLKRYAVFSGRATRSEYWYFVLFNILITYSPFVIGSILGVGGDGSIIIAALVGIYSLAVIIPSIAVGVRRLHDTDHSGWWMFISLIPLIGTIILLFFLVTDSQAGENKYGKNPKEAIVG